MKPLSRGLLFCTGAVGVATLAAAQPPAMRMPAVPQAIETHLQQQRTRQQREAMERQAAPPPATPLATDTLPAPKDAKRAPRRNARPQTP